MKEVTLLVDKKGKMSAEVSGTVGPACLDTLKQLQDAMGAEGDEPRKKDAFFETNEDASVGTGG